MNLVQSFLGTPMRTTLFSLLYCVAFFSVLSPPSFARQRNPAILSISLSTPPEDAGLQPSSVVIDTVLIHKDNNPIGYRSIVDKYSLTRQIRRLQQQITSLQPLSVQDSQSPARALYDLLIGPVSRELRDQGVTDILISLDRGLQALPISALHSGESYFGLEYSFSITPALLLTSITTSSPTTSKLLALGASQFSALSDLPLVPAEINTISSIMPSESYINRDFTPDILTKHLPQSSFRRVHVATHADFSAGGPDAAIIYTGTEPLKLSEFKQSRLGNPSNKPIDLFVLSACRTAIGDEDSELGFAGLALQTGANSAIGTLWYVDDLATTLFFIQYYKLLERGLTKADALRTTRRAFADQAILVRDSSINGLGGETLLSNLDPVTLLKARTTFEHPYFWSGIALLGSPW